MLVDQDWVSVRVNRHEVSWSRRALVRFRRESHALRLQTALQFPHAGELLEWFDARRPG